MTISELAYRAGVTVKAVRHYERKELIFPSRRDSNGYRIYGEDSLKRLKTIRLFRQLGFSLAQIKRVMDRPAEALAELMREHGRRLERELERVRELRAEVRMWEVRLQHHPLDERDFEELVEVHLDMEKHFSKKAIKTMKEHHERAGQARQDEARVHLERLVEEKDGAGLRKLMTEFMGAKGVEEAFASDQALHAILLHHELDLSMATVSALRNS